MIRKPTSTGAPSRKKLKIEMKKKTPLFFVLGSLFLVLCFLWWQDFLLPADKKNEASKIFVVKKGESIKEISARLKEENLIKNSFLFQVLIQNLGIAKKIQAGDFRLSSSMTAKEIALELTHGTIDLWITIPEGLRVEEIAEIVSSKFKVQSSKFISEVRDYEGYLFPDTYLIPKDADNLMIIKIMTDNFHKKVGGLINLEKAEKEELEFNGLDLDELIILASIIEREAKHENDRPKVASVLYNRLKIEMKLDIDATVQYALATESCKLNTLKCDWWPKKLTHNDLIIDSPFNTYLKSGLPPKPICNPGLSSIKAVLSPDKTNFFYYLSDKEGRIHFSKTLEEHNQNIKKYIL